MGFDIDYCAAAVETLIEAGVDFNLPMDIWCISDDTDVNYMLTAVKG